MFFKSCFILQYALSLLCQVLTKAEFDAIDDLDKLFTLGMTTHGEGCHTVVISSKRTITNALHCYEACNVEGICLTADYKWKLTRNQWPLGVLGTDQIMGKKGEVHSMIPFILGWSTSESIDSFEFLLETFLQAIDEFFGIKDLNVVSANIDHSQSLRYMIIAFLIHMSTRHLFFVWLTQYT